MLQTVKSRFVFAFTACALAATAALSAGPHPKHQGPKPPIKIDAQEDVVTILPVYVEALNDETFETFLSQNSVAIVDFTANWCGPCRRFGPIFEKVAEEMAGTLAFAKLDVDQGKTACQNCSVNSIPTIIFFKDGQEIARRVGGLNENTLKEFILSLL